MSDTQRDVRMSGDPSDVRTEDARTPEPATGTVALMLANPRRVRRS